MLYLYDNYRLKFVKSNIIMTNPFPLCKNRKYDFDFNFSLILIFTFHFSFKTDIIVHTMYRNKHFVFDITKNISKLLFKLNLVYYKLNFNFVIY